MGGGCPRAELTSYVGRRREADQVRRLLDAGRLVTLCGPGGVGKTRLAYRVARDHGDDVLAIELAELRDGTLLPNLVADRLGLHDETGQSLTGRVIGHLGERAVLLVLDNCEHLVTACAEFVHALLSGCPGAAVLATSRQSLNVVGEQVMWVPPLGVPGEEAAPSPAELAQYESVQLFADRASAVWPDFEVTAANCAEVAELCRRLDGVPLAIELAAARIRTLSPRQIVDRLPVSLGLLTTGKRDSPERQQTLRDTIDWSHGLCSGAEQVVWARVAVFAGSFDLRGAEHVCSGPGVAPEAVLGLIDGLVDKSVLLRSEEDGEARYRMLETLREYGQERLQESGDRERVARRHRDWFDRLTARADAEWAGPGQAEWVRRLRRDHADLRTALDWSVAEPGEAGVALRMAARIDEYWTLRGFNAEALMWLDRALDAAPADHPDRPLALVVSAQHALWLFDLDGVDERLTAAEELAAGFGDELLDARIALVRSLEAVLRLDPRVAELAAAAAPVLRKHGDFRRELRALFLQSSATAHTDLDASREALRRVIALGESRGDTYGRDMALFGFALIELTFGDVEPAAEAAHAALVSTSAVDSHFGDAFHIETLAWVAGRRGEHVRAATLFGAASTAWELLGSSSARMVSRPHARFRENTERVLGAGPFADAYAAGRSLSKDDARRYALGEDAPPAPAHDNPLTARELEVAELVATGLSNRDIASRLFVARRTADTHVQRILAKLGFTNRAQIAAWATTRRLGQSR
ncbi:ATP-binding protein [Saccharopolyspora taberi]|uniref:LuxR C-terminal-related transcriptional regulator n=1 Tax=Saccharopolyspora taberi TaxID=60895 RepID=A0ABN3VBK9_9PSEU